MTTWATARPNAWRPVAFGMFAVGWGANQFTSLLIAYRGERGLSAATADALFGVYALALVVALLLGGPAADHWGRRVVVRPAVAASVVATGLLIAGDHHVGLLFAGRFVAGLASGAIFAAGSAWVKELSAAPWSPSTREGAGAQRAALSLSLGFGVGPLVTGMIAQWAPAPLIIAYLPHLAIAVVALVGVWNAPETVPASDATTYRERLRIRGIGQRRFLGVVAPGAIWVFGGASVAMVVLPSLVSAHLHGYALAFSGLTAAITLGTGVAVQGVARRLDRPGRVAGQLLGLGAHLLGLLLAIWTAVTANPVLSLLAAVPLGAGYGLGLVSGLLETQRLAAPHELAGLTAVYYALTYVGFGLPLLLATLHAYIGYPAMLAGLAVAVVLCAIIVGVNSAAPLAGVRREPVAEPL